MDSLETFNKNMQDKVAAWDNEIDKITNKVKNTQDDAYRSQKIKELIELQESAYKKLANLQETSGDSWRDLHVDTQRDWLEFEKKMTDALEELK